MHYVCMQTRTPHSIYSSPTNFHLCLICCNGNYAFKYILYTFCIYILYIVDVGCSSTQNGICTSHIYSPKVLLRFLSLSLSLCPLLACLCFLSGTTQYGEFFLCCSGTHRDTHTHSQQPAQFA